MSDRLLVGLDFGGTKIGIALATSDGTRVAETVLSTEAERGAEQAVERAVLAAQTMLSNEDATAAAVGAATMGITHEDRVELAPNVPGWDRLALPALLHETFGSAAIGVANDVKAAALAELTWGELAGVGTGVYLNLGTGLAAALVVGGAVVEGAHGAAGEIGYWARSRADAVGAQHGHAPLEEYAGGAGARARARDELGIGGGVAALVDSDDPRAAAFLADLHDEIAMHAANLAIVLDAERMVVGGGYARSSEQLMARLGARLEAWVPYPPQLRLARFGGDAALAGAIALAMRAAHRGENSA